MIGGVSVAFVVVFERCLTDFPVRSGTHGCENAGDRATRVRSAVVVSICAWRLALVSPLDEAGQVAMADVEAVCAVGL